MTSSIVSTGRFRRTRKRYAPWDHAEHAEIPFANCVLEIGAASGALRT